MIHAPKTTRVVGAIALFSLAAALVAVAACENQTGTYVYRGRQYDPEKKCLGATRALDILDLTTEPALCAPVCLVQDKYDDGGIAVYVSNVCPPYPPDFDTSESNALCREALEAAGNASGCLPLPKDAGPDASDATAPEQDAGDAASPDASDAASPDASDGAPADAGTDAGDASDASG